jgi:hypothetical protein
MRKFDFETGRIRPEWKFDPHTILEVRLVSMCKPLTHFAGADADEGLFLCIEVFSFAKDVDADISFLDLFPSALEGFFDYVAKESLTPLAMREWCT